MQPSIDPTNTAGAIALSQLVATDFRYILEHALREREAGLGLLTERLGLSGAELAALRDRWAPQMDLPDLDQPLPERTEDQHAIFTLILWRGNASTAEARWLAAILARRSMESRHLWEDLGLPSRPDLSAMIARQLPRLAEANNQNMRWKKFFYRQICADSAFSLCLTPSCEDCDERASCFVPD